MTQRSTLIGLAGEYAAASELCKRGWLAMLPPAGHRDWDILATREDIIRRIQVKSTERKATWMMNQKAEIPVADLLFVFVTLADMRFWIVPALVVAQDITASHRAWLAGDLKRQDSAMRKWRANPDWENRWDLLHP